MPLQNKNYRFVNCFFLMCDHTYHVKSCNNSSHKFTVLKCWPAGPDRVPNTVSGQAVSSVDGTIKRDGGNGGITCKSGPPTLIPLLR